MKAVLEYVQRNRRLIDDYFVLKHPCGTLTLYYASEHKPGEFDRDELMDRIANDQDDVFELRPGDFAELKTALGV